MTVETMSSKPPVDQQSASDTAGNKPKDPELDLEISRLSTEDIASRTRLLEHEIRIMRSDIQRLNHELSNYAERIKENKERIKVNKHLPYLVANVIELLDLDGFASDEQEGANVDLDASKTKCAVIKTSTRATYFLPVIGLVEAGDLNPGDLVGVNKDSYLILEKLPIEYDSRVKAMEIDERPTEQYSDIGGLDTQIQELIEAVVLPMTHKERFVKLGIQPSKGVLLYGPPGTGKTMMARAVAAQTKSTFLKLAGPQLVQMFIGDGAKLVRDAFALAKEKAPAIIFIDELDAIVVNSAEMLSVTCRTGCLRRFPLILQAISASHSSFNRLRGKQFGEVLYSASRQLAPRSHFKPIFNVSLSTSAQYENAVSYEELKALIEAHDVLLIDVRDPEEITNQGRIIDAVNIPLGQLPEAFEMDDESFFKKYKFEKPHKFDANVVFHGLSHIKSTAAVEIAHRHGFTKTRHFPGGWEEWIRQEKS